jgi:hypothetical protein
VPSWTFLEAVLEILCIFVCPVLHPGTTLIIYNMARMTEELNV